MKKFFLKVLPFPDRKTTRTLCLKRIHFVWITRDVQQLALFSKTLSELAQMVCEV
jgi:hypothetical protein